MNVEAIICGMYALAGLMAGLTVVYLVKALAHSTKWTHRLVVWKRRDGCIMYGFRCPCCGQLRDVTYSKVSYRLMMAAQRSDEE